MILLKKIYDDRVVSVIGEIKKKYHISYQGVTYLASACIQNAVRDVFGKEWTDIDDEEIDYIIKWKIVPFMRKEWVVKFDSYYNEYYVCKKPKEAS